MPVKNAPLDEIIRRIKEKGPLTFAEFMDVALYWPGGGYYTAASGRRWGAGGDYVTNLDISPVFARMLAKQIHQMWRILGSPPVFHCVEAGAGRGWLTDGVMAAARELYPDFSRAIRVSIIEKNPALGKTDGTRSSHGDISEIAGHFTGCIYSEELLDAMPFHRVVMRGNGLKEIYVGYEDNRGLFDAEGEISTEELSEYFEDLPAVLDGLPVGLIEGQRAEVGLEAKRWIRKAAGLLDRGFIITVDYGMPAGELYSAGRSGTLLCHFRHTMNDDPYRMVGAQDITCHVDFTTIRNEGIKAGLGVSGFTTQRNFLLGMGVLEELTEVPDPTAAAIKAIGRNQGIKELVMPGGIGDAMKILIQHRGVDAPRLAGFSFRDMTGMLGAPKSDNLRPGQPVGS
ncbi:MAG: SAM-dependent methyltransferase [Deltaproteobacteria bacterium]|nr:SAM-dependent methyltransferase [Deltaproteobacteria bacterium]